VVLDRDAERPLPVQLAAALRELIDLGTLRPGEPVPATRPFAHRLGVARGVVVSAYEQLLAEGYLRAERGRGTIVNPELRGSRVRQGNPLRRETASSPDPEHGADPVLPRPPLAPGAPVTDAVLRSPWRAAWREAAARVDRPAPPFGDARLRHEIAEHLRLVRGTSRSADDVLVTAGTREGLGLLLTALGTTRGHGLVVGVEDPGYPSLRGVAARHGARILSLPVDADGLRVDRLPSGVLDLVIVTPSHQYPVGGSLPLPRRRELLEWAARTGVIVIEDDYDSEFRSIGGPLPALAALDDPDSGAVVTLGTFSSLVSPALSAGFLLAPARIRTLLEPVRRDLGAPVSTVVQVALAEYLASGELRRNIARVRRRHAVRRDLISERLAGIPGVRPRPMSGGLHAVIEFTAGTASAEELFRREARLVDRAAEPTPQLPNGLGIAALGAYWQHQSRERVAGLVLGMGGPDDEEFAAAIDRLGALLDSAQ